jgi:hypothetical protein
VLQSYRTVVGDEQVPQDVALEHLLTATTGPGIGGLPASEGHGVGGLPASEGHGVGPAAQYGMPGWGGRTPVNWIGPKPARNPAFAGRRPVVAVLDTGVGSHPWLDDASTVVRNPTIEGAPGGPPLGLTDPLTDPERTGVLVDPYEGILDSDAGAASPCSAAAVRGCVATARAPRSSAPCRSRSTHRFNPAPRWTS